MKFLQILTNIAEAGINIKLYLNEQLWDSNQLNVVTKSERLISVLNVTTYESIRSLILHDVTWCYFVSWSSKVLKVKSILISYLILFPSCVFLQKPFGRFYSISTHKSYTYHWIIRCSQTQIRVLYDISFQGKTTDPCVTESSIGLTFINFLHQRLTRLCHLS